MLTMTMDDVREIARANGILSVDKFKRKIDLIQLIQLAEGREPCFMINSDCRGGVCMWREECVTARQRPAEA